LVTLEDVGDRIIMSLIVTSDIHLGRYKYGRLNSKTNLDFRTEDILNNVDSVLSFAKKSKAKYMAILGDLYHLKRPLEIFRRALSDKLYKILQADIELFIILGNHDQGKTAAHDLVEFSVLSRMIDKFHVIDRPEIIEREDYLFCFFPHVNQIELNIANEDFYKYQIDQITELGKKADKSKQKYKMFFGHFTTDQSKLGNSFDIGTSAKSAGKIIPAKIFSQANWTKVYLGDIHKAQEITDVLRHPGSIARVDFGEEHDEKGFFYFNQGKDEFVRLEDRQFQTLEVNLTTDPRKEMAKFCEDVQDLDLSKSISRLMVTIKQKDRGLINFKGIEEYLKESSWNYVGKTINEVQDDQNVVTINESTNLDYVKTFKNFVHQIRDEIEPEIFEDVLTEGEDVLSKILNEEKR
jgi:DNA repair protein SbcD/Mre11